MQSFGHQLIIVIMILVVIAIVWFIMRGPGSSIFSSGNEKGKGKKKSHFSNVSHSGEEIFEESDEYSKYSDSAIMDKDTPIRYMDKTGMDEEDHSEEKESLAEDVVYYVAVKDLNRMTIQTVSVPEYPIRRYIGKEKESCDVLIPGKYVSRIHAYICRNKDADHSGIYLFDDSTNGTYLDNLEKIQEVELVPGEKVRLYLSKPDMQKGKDITRIELSLLTEKDIKRRK